MKLIANRESLRDAFSAAAAFVSRNDAKPILQMVKITANGKVSLQATDLKVGCRINCENIEVQKTGSAMLPIDRIGGLLKESTDDVIQIEATKDKVTAKTNRGSFAMNSTSIDDFPDVATFDHNDPHFEVEATAFSAGLKLVALATEAEGSRYALGSVMIDGCESTMHLIATDGRRMSRYQMPCSNTGNHDPANQVLIRDSQLVRIARALGDGNLKIHARENDVLFSCGDREFYARMSHGRFPDWKRLPWDPTETLFQTLCGPLLATIRQAALMLGKGKEDSRAIDMHISAGTLTIKADISERGKVEVEMPVAYQGKDVVASLDVDYLTDWLNAVGMETTLEFDPSDGNARVLFRAFDGTAQYVLMPLSKDR